MTTLRTGQITDFSNQRTEYEVDYMETDGSISKGTKYTPEWTKYHGYYRQIPELRAVINKFASWTFGRAIKADKKNLDKLKKIKGFGKDTARSVLKNLWRTALICGDSFAHIIKDKQGRLTNLKPLNSGRTSIIANEEGIVAGYMFAGSEKLITAEEIYHLSYERIADEIHGIPFPEALEELILMRNEGLGDLRVLYHRTVKPIQFFEVETDDTTKLNNIETTINSAYKKSENVVIPSGVIKEIKNTAIAQYGSLDSLNFIKFLVRQFVTACGMPEVVMGWGSETTEASSKVIVTSYEQEIFDMKIYNEEQAKEQLGIEFNIEPAPSIMDELKEDKEKDKNQEKIKEPIDTKLNIKGKK
jgi:hypothetical protein